MTGETIRKLTEKLRGNKYVLAALIFGIVLMLVPTVKKSPSETKESSDYPDFSVVSEEKKLEAMLSAIDGAGKVKVMLSLSSGAEQVLASDSEARDGEERRETVVLSSGSGKQNAVTVKYVYPAYRGAAVIAQGAGSAAVRLAITQTVSAVTGLDTAKISVIKMKQ